jgi:hypothetical protein
MALDVHIPEDFDPEEHAKRRWMLTFKSFLLSLPDDEAKLEVRQVFTEWWDMEQRAAPIDESKKDEALARALNYWQFQIGEQEAELRKGWKNVKRFQMIYTVLAFVYVVLLLWEIFR